MPDDDVILALYAAVTCDDAFSLVLERLARRFRCRSSALVYVDRERPLAEFAVSYGIVSDPAVQRRYWEHYADHDPAPATMAALALGKAAATDRLFSQEFKAGSPFINEFYHPIGLRETLGGPIVDGAGRSGVVAVHRGDDRPPFDDDDIADFERILPHVITAARLRRRFFELETRASSLEMALEPTSAGIMALDETGRLVHGNRRARAILDRRKALTLDPAGRVRARVGQDDAALQRCLGDQTPGDGTTVIRFRTPDGSPGLIGAVRKSESIASGRTGLSLHLSELDPGVGNVAASLAQAVGLSGPASRLVVALLNGESLNGYARRTGLSVNTVRSHLQAAFDATGCRRQADLVRVAGRLIGDLTLDDTGRRSVAASEGEPSRRTRADD